VVKVEQRGVSAPAWRRGLVHGPMFLWLGRPDDEHPAIAVKLTNSHEHAIAVAGAELWAHSGLGQWGWVTFALSATDTDLACEWVEESYRNVAPKKLGAELDEHREPPAGDSAHR
jgi:hypothetical protein